MGNQSSDQYTGNQPGHIHGHASRKRNDDAKSTTSQRAPIPGGMAGAPPGETGPPEWDSSTNAGERDKGPVSANARAMAEQMLAEADAASRALVSRAQEQADAALVEATKNAEAVVKKADVKSKSVYREAAGIEKQVNELAKQEGRQGIQK